MNQLISEELFAFAVDLSDEGVREFAFPSIVACEVFGALSFGGCSILGGDLWKRVDGGFAFGQETWHVGGDGSAEGRWRVFFDLFSGEDSFFSFVFRGSSEWVGSDRPQDPEARFRKKQGIPLACSPLFHAAEGFPGALEEGV